MKVISTFLLLLLAMVNIKAQEMVKSVFDKDVLTSDTEYFFSTLEKVHPNLYAYHTKENVLAIQNEITQQLADSMSLYNFTKLLEIKTNSLFDEHTGLKRCFYQQNTIPDSTYLLPFKVISVYQGNLYLTEGKKEYKITSINNKPSKEIIEDMRLILGADKTAYTKDCTIEDNFTTFYYHLYGSSELFHLIIEQNQNNVKTTVQGRLKDHVYANNHNDIAPFELIIRNSVAYMKINTFRNNLKDEFEAFLTQSFNNIAQAKIEYLFIDISKNTGGSTNNANLLLDYLYPDSYRFMYGYYIKRYSQFYIDEWKSQFHSEFNSKEKAEEEYSKWRSSITSEFVTSSSDWERVNKVDFPYLKNLFIIQSYKTASASLDFSSAIKSSNRGLIIGEPTGDPAYSFSESINLTMPNTQLSFSCAIGFFALPSGSFNSNIGILPDIYCNHKDLRQDTDSMFSYFKSIIAKYSNQKNPTDSLTTYNYY